MLAALLPDPPLLLTGQDDRSAGQWTITRRAMACEFTIHLHPLTRDPITVANTALREIEQLPMPDVARRLGISVAAAKSRLLRARIELRARLAEATRAGLSREAAFRRVYQIPGMTKVNQALGRLVRAPGQRARVVAETVAEERHGAAHGGCSRADLGQLRKFTRRLVPGGSQFDVQLLLSGKREIVKAIRKLGINSGLL
jgi:hypothetical protein